MRRYSPGVPFGLGIWEILILLGILVLLFGTKNAPKMARRLGTGVREMKDAVTEMDPRSLLDGKDEAQKALPPAQPSAAATPAAAQPAAAAPAAAAPAAAASAPPGAASGTEDEQPPS
jgi:TatA/E family protein of Tat protein translocase